MIKIKDLFKIEQGTLASENSEEGEFDFITASYEWKKHNAFTHNKEALVYAIKASGSLGKSQYVKGKFIASNLCIILTSKSPKEYPVNLRFYNEYFNAIRKKIFYDISDGTSKLTIREEDFKEYYIEYIPIEKQDAFVKDYIMKIARAKKRLKKDEESVLTNITKMVE